MQSPPSTKESSSDNKEDSAEELLLSQALASSAISGNGNFIPGDRENDVREVLLEEWNRTIVEDCSTVESRVTKDWFERLWNAHTEKARHYHTVIHLEEMIGIFDLFHRRNFPPNMSRNERKAIILAIFFHDAIYDAQSATNEEDSAKLFEEFADEVGIAKTNPSLKTTVVDFIVATKKHEISSRNPRALALFLDFDMAVLGKQPRAYAQYAHLIRKEYIFVPHDVYCEKRADILKAFLKHQFIFGTTVMRLAFEDRARENLANEIDLLCQGFIPTG